MVEDIGSRDVVLSVVRGIRVLETFDGIHATLGLDEVAARSGISRSATRRLLLTLEDAGLVSADPARRLFRLTPGVLELGGYVRLSQLSLTEVVEPHCHALSESSNCSVGLACLDGNELVYLSRISAPQYMEFGVRAGSRLPAHVLAIGRAQLAWRSDDELRAYAASPQFRDNLVHGLSDADDLLAEMSLIRERGWAYIQGSADDGLSAISTPIRDSSGAVVAGLNIAGRGEAITMARLAEDLLATTRDIAKDLHPRHRL